MEEQARTAGKPEGAAQEQGPQQMRPEEALARHQGKPQKAVEKHDAVGQIQKSREPGQLSPDSPEQVIGNGQQEAQTHGQQKGPRLTGDWKLHQPNSLASRPAPLGASSS